jgi:hypothetical protein
MVMDYLFLLVFAYPNTTMNVRLYILICVACVGNIKSFVLPDALKLRSLSKAKEHGLVARPGAQQIAAGAEEPGATRMPPGSNRRNQFHFQIKAFTESPDADIVQRAEAVPTHTNCQTMEVLEKPQLLDPNSTLAREFYAHPYFYANATSDYYQAKLASDSNYGSRLHMFRDYTVQEIWTWSLRIDNVKDWFSKVGIHGEQVFSYGPYTIEDKLHDRIIPLSGFDEIDRAEEQFVPLDSWNRLLFWAYLGLWNTKDVLYICGPCGSGKTQLSVKVAATRALHKLPLHTTIYVKLTEIKFNATDHKGLMKWIQDELSNIHPDYDRNKKLKMHVTLVLDDATSASLDGLFGVDENAPHIYTLMGEVLAESVRLIFCGAGVTTKQPAAENVTMIRMSHWTETDVRMVATKRFQLPSNVVDAILADGVLASLTKNARLACILLATAEQIYSANHSAKVTVFEGIGDLVPDIIRVTVDKFIDQSFLKRLNPLLRRRLAALVFYMAAQARLEVRKPGGVSGLYIPEREGLVDGLQDMACEFMRWNVRFVHGEPSRISNQPQPHLIVYGMLNTGLKFTPLFDNSEPSGIVSPPLAIVLSTVLGASPTVWVGEHSAGLFALQAQAISGVAQYLKASKDCRHDARNELDKSLRSLSLVKSRKRVPEPRAGASSLSIPLLPGTATWMNAHGAPFADVIAPFVLYKRCGRHGNGAVDIFEELMKCGLLKPEVVETLLEDGGKAVKRASVGSTIMAGVCACWKDAMAVDDHLPANSSASAHSQETEWTGQRRASDNINYMCSNQFFQDRMGGTHEGYNDIIASVRRIRFVFLFGERGLIIKYDKDALSLEDYHVDADGNVCEELLDPVERSRLALFREACKERVRENVEIRFVYQPH